MAEIDPYAVLGVPRTATRAEIARAYRGLAKRTHPDTGAVASPAQMARLNDAWRILGDPARRARWDREHLVTLAPPHWSSPAPTVRVARPVAPEAPPSRMDSGWVAAGVVAMVAALVGVVMIAVSAVAQPPRETLPFESGDIRFEYPDSWHLRAGEGADPAGHQVIAHLLSFPAGDDDWCVSFTEPCRWTGDALPAGAASVLVIGWEGGEPPVADPLIRRPFGLDADALIGGRPAAFDLQATGQDSVVAWWQLSPPTFPERWIEVTASIRGADLERMRLIERVEAMLDTIEFEE